MANGMEGAPKVSLYEQCREERIKENLERMQNLGILNLSLKLKSETRPVKRPYGGNSNSSQKSTPLLHPSRRSSRLESSALVTYTEVKGKSSKRKSVVIREGPRAEIYTEEHEKLLGNTERSWTRFVDGYDKDGKRIYDPFKGKTCHQCRQKTLGHRTRCSECDMVQGQFCGDCLFMRYGEHVLEALENPNWVCPVCRGICNCSLCRNHRGWAPTGPIYRQIAELGYKSVAHYLIQTKRLQTDDNNDISEGLVVPMLQNMENQNSDSLKKEVNENTNENPNLADVQVIGYREPSNEDKQVQDKTEQKPKIATRADSYLHSGENQTLVVHGQDLVLCDVIESGGNSVNTSEIRRRRKAALEPSPDSIGGRLRQRRRSRSVIEEDENMNSAGKTLSLILPCVDDQMLSADVQVLDYLEPSKEDKQVEGRTKQKLNLDTRLDSYLLSQDLVLCDETQTPSVNKRESKRKKVASEPNPNSIGGRVRQRRRSQSVIEKDENTNKSLDSVGRSLSLVLSSVNDQSSLVDDDLQVLGYLEPSENYEQYHSCANIDEGAQTSNLDTGTLSCKTSMRKMVVEPNQDSIGGRLRQRRNSQSGLRSLCIF